MHSFLQRQFQILINSFLQNHSRHWDLLKLVRHNPSNHNCIFHVCCIPYMAWENILKTIYLVLFYNMQLCVGLSHQSHIKPIVVFMWQNIKTSTGYENLLCLDKITAITLRAMGFSIISISIQVPFCIPDNLAYCMCAFSGINIDNYKSEFWTKSMPLRLGTELWWVRKMPQQ